MFITEKGTMKHFISILMLSVTSCFLACNIFAQVINVQTKMNQEEQIRKRIITTLTHFLPPHQYAININLQGTEVPGTGGRNIRLNRIEADIIPYKKMSESLKKYIESVITVISARVIPEIKPTVKWSEFPDLPEEETPQTPNVTPELPYANMVAQNSGTEFSTKEWIFVALFVVIFILILSLFWKLPILNTYPKTVEHVHQVIPTPVQGNASTDSENQKSALESERIALENEKKALEEKIIKQEYSPKKNSLLSFEESDPFDFLKRLNVEQIASLIRDEELEIKSLIISRIDSKKAADLIKHIPRDQQTGVLLCLEKIQKELPLEGMERIKEIAFKLADKSTMIPDEKTLTFDSNNHLISILTNSQPEIQKMVLRKMHKDSPFGKEVKSRCFLFGSIPFVPVDVLQKALEILSTDDFITALIGCSNEIQNKLIEAYEKIPEDRIIHMIRKKEEEKPDQLVIQHKQNLITQAVQKLASKGEVDLLKINEEWEKQEIV